ncbi:MAG: histidine phosphatase family protein [Erysipelotrichaceae bacterium]|nr:histidine phosphatase family protein [Erysipelotrichaceae bacterium]
MTRIYIVRHGIGVYNTLHRIAGHTDCPLTDIGIMQAYAAKKHYKRIKLDCAYSSDLKRALKTGQIITEDKDLKIHKTKKLRERHYGKLDDLPSALYREKGYFVNDIHEFGGENEWDVADRAIKAVTAIAEKEAGKKILITTHEAFIIYLLWAIDYDNYKDFHDGDHVIPNCATTVLEYGSRGFRIIKVGDDSYIPKELRVRN